MELLQEKTITCPYCGEAIDIQVDCSVSQQRYIEDCAVCCRPINIDVSVGNGDVMLNITHENE